MIKIINSGILSSFQDKGRFGQKKIGVSKSGALDLFSFQLANRLSGNDINEPCIETLGGFSCEFYTDLVLSITGPSDSFTINNNYIYKTNSSFKVMSGDKLEIPFPQNGNIFYLSVSGGFNIDKILGSYSYHQPSSITNNLRISSGDEIHVKTSNNKNIFLSENSFFKKWILNDENINIIYDDKFKSQNLRKMFENKEFTISDQFSRQGIRLIGDPIDAFKEQNEISSEVSAGTVQIPPDGQPIILLNDSQTTGGYKKIGVIPSFELSKISQKPISSKLKFSEISLSNSIKNYREMRSEFDNIKIYNYTNRILKINDRLISVQILENNSIMAISSNKQFDIIEESFE